MKKLFICFVIIVVAFVLIALCLQVFATNEKLKPTNWFVRNNKNSLTNISVGQKLNGIRFDTSITPDLSKFQMDEYGFCNLIDGYEDDGEELMYHFGIGDLNVLFGEENSNLGRCIVIRGQYIVYTENDLPDWNGETISKGWNYNLLDENGVAYFYDKDRYITVTDVLHSPLWNGVFATASVYENVENTANNLVSLKVGEDIKGLQFNLNSIDLSSFETFMSEYNDVCLLARFNSNDYLYVMRYRDSNNDNKGLALVYTLGSSREETSYENKIIYCTSNFIEPNGNVISSGWHLVENNGILSFSQSVQVTEVFNSEYWNGVFVGTV